MLLNSVIPGDEEGFPGVLEALANTYCKLGPPFPSSHSPPHSSFRLFLPYAHPSTLFKQVKSGWTEHQINDYISQIDSLNTMCRGFLLKLILPLMKIWEEEKGGQLFLAPARAFSSKPMGIGLEVHLLRAKHQWDQIAFGSGVLVRQDANDCTLCL